MVRLLVTRREENRSRHVQKTGARRRRGGTKLRQTVKSSRRVYVRRGRRRKKRKKRKGADTPRRADPRKKRKGNEERMSIPRENATCDIHAMNRHVIRAGRLCLAVVRSGSARRNGAWQLAQLPAQQALTQAAASPPICRGFAYQSVRVVSLWTMINSTDRFSL